MLFKQSGNLLLPIRKASSREPSVFIASITEERAAETVSRDGK